MPGLASHGSARGKVKEAEAGKYRREAPNFNLSPDGKTVIRTVKVHTQHGVGEGVPNRLSCVVYTYMWA